MPERPDGLPPEPADVSVQPGENESSTENDNITHPGITIQKDSLSTHTADMEGDMWVVLGRAYRGARIPVILPVDPGSRISRHVIKGKTATIGRGPDCDIRVTDEKASRRHAQITWHNFGRPSEFPRCTIEDCDSHNGLFVNSQRLKGTFLTDGDRILIGSTVMGFFIKDQSELEFEDRLLVQATTDPLTGLANRASWEDLAARVFGVAMRHGQKLCLAVADLDRLKDVNDRLGHAAGDALLRHAADALTSSLRGSDLIARIGGDEFGVLLPETDLPGAVMAMENIRRRLFQFPCRLAGDRQVPLTFSIGIAPIRPSHQSWTDLCAEADENLLRAKAAGRDSICAHAEPPSAGNDPPALG